MNQDIGFGGLGFLYLLLVGVLVDWFYIPYAKVCFMTAIHLFSPNHAAGQAFRRKAGSGMVFASRHSGRRGIQVGCHLQPSTHTL